MPASSSLERLVAPLLDDEFRKFVESHYSELLGTAYLLCGSKHAAEDAVQSALLRSMRHWSGITDPTSYVRRVMVSQRISRWRRASRLREYLAEALPDGFLLARAALGGLPTPAPIWTGSLPALGDRPAIVSASTSPAGGVAAVLQVETSGKVLIVGPKALTPQGSDVADPDWKNASLVTTASGASPELLAVRIPRRHGESATWSSEVLVVANPAATEVRAVYATGALVGRAKLTEGVGTIRIDAPSSVILRSYNAQQQTLAKSPFRETDDTGPIFGAPAVDRW